MWSKNLFLPPPVRSGPRCRAWKSLLAVAPLSLAPIPVHRTSNYRVTTGSEAEDRNLRRIVSLEIDPASTHLVSASNLECRAAARSGANRTAIRPPVSPSINPLLAKHPVSRPKFIELSSSSSPLSFVGPDINHLAFASVGKWTLAHVRHFAEAWRAILMLTFFRFRGF